MLLSIRPTATVYKAIAFEILRCDDLYTRAMGDPNVIARTRLVYVTTVRAPLHNADNAHTSGGACYF